MISLSAFQIFTIHSAANGSLSILTIEPYWKFWYDLLIKSTSKKTGPSMYYNSIENIFISTKIFFLISDYSGINEDIKLFILKIGNVQGSFSKNYNEFF